MMPSVTMLATCWFAEPVTDRLATEQPDSNGSGTAPPRRGVIGFFVHHRLAANLVMLVMLLGADPHERAIFPHLRAGCGQRKGGVERRLR